jgi:hypothetical protein
MSSEPAIGTFEEAQWFHLRRGLALTAIERLRDLENMRRFNADAEARNPSLRWAAERLRNL